jgi:hypothetical protein
MQSAKPLVDGSFDTATEYYGRPSTTYSVANQIGAVGFVPLMSICLGSDSHSLSEYARYPNMYTARHCGVVAAPLVVYNDFNVWMAKASSSYPEAMLWWWPWDRD